MKQTVIDSKTELYGVLGDPVSHSLSPVMHNSAFEAIGYNGAYMAFEVKDIVAAVKGIRGLGLKGASVTIPHKISVMDCLDEIDDEALKIGAVNTIINKNGKLFGYNSDCLGAVNALLEKTEINDKHVVLAGAGGAARAIGFGIKSHGGRLTILNQFIEEGENLAKDLSAEFRPLEEYKQVDNCDIIINATPLGMTPDTDSMPVGSDWLNPGMTVMDIVYNPLKTKLLQEAEKKGCVTVDGVSMFVYQGVSQFESWTNAKAPVELMRNTVLNALGY